MAYKQQVMTPGELADQLGDVQHLLPQAAERILKVHNEANVRDAVQNRMSGQYLGVVTGTARRSTQPTPITITSSAEVSGGFGSPLDYVRAHELGFHGKVNVKAHTRQNVKLQTSARTGKVTKKSAAQYKQAALTGRKRIVHVRAHARQMDIEAKYFYHDTLFQGIPDLRKRVLMGFETLGRTGKLPKLSDLKVT